MNILREYTKYKFSSKGKHQIHSPYVFDFVTKCLTKKTEKTTKDKLKKIHKKLRSDNTMLTISDFGAGSKTLSKERSIAQIFKTAASKGVYADLLFQITNFYPCTQVLELGTSLGMGTIRLAQGNPSAKVTTLDACLETQRVAKRNCAEIGLENIEFVHSDFESYLQHLTPSQFDVVFIDGHHNGKALIHYFDLLQQHSHDESIFILDDIRWSDDMLKAWEELCKRPEIHLSMDLFRMGIIVRRSHQAKEHFVIRLKNVILSM